MTTKTKSQVIAADVQALMRARNPLLWIVTREEARAESYLMEAAAAAGYIPRTWDVAAGVCALDGTPQSSIGDKDPGATLEAIRQRAMRNNEPDNRGAWIMRDLPVWLTGAPGASTCRQVRNLARLLPGVAAPSAQSLIVITPSTDIPPELAGHATVIDWPLPDREEIAEILTAAIDVLPEDEREGAVNGERDAAIDAAVGLTGEEAAACYARSLVLTRRIDVAMVAQEKKRAIARERVLEWFDPIPGGLDAIGGLENVKEWLVERTSAYSPKARAYGLPAPKGMLIVGHAGTGKSLTAKSVGTAWTCPVVRLDLGALQSKFVGESQGNIRKALAQIEAIGKCVVWIDEIEKALQGATSGSADGGVSADALGTLLTWMQERAGDAFVIATANDVSTLPPELLRKGRFDEVWFVDLPHEEERVAIVEAAMRQHKRGGALTVRELREIAVATESFTGAEIAAIIPDALYTAFADDAREVTVRDILAAASKVVPLSRTAKEKIDSLRQWASSRARTASKPADVKVKSGSLGVPRGRRVDL